MADNTIINPGSGGDAIATDDIGGVKFQRVKVTHGADGSATDVSSASPLPVDTELPAAAALSDSTANPTAPMVGAAVMAWDTSTSQWVRANNARPDAGSVPTRNLPAVQPYFLHDTAAGGVSYGAQTAYKVGDGASGTQGGVSAPWLYNGASFDRQRGNTEGTLLASASRNGSVNASYVLNHNSRGRLFIWLDVTAPNGTSETLNVFIAGVNPVNTKKTYLTKTGLVFTQTESAKCIGWIISPGAVADSDNVDTSIDQVRKVSNSFVPRYWGLDVFVGGGSTPSTFSVGYSLI